MNANQHKNCRQAPWPEGDVAFVYEGDRASRIKRVRIQNLLIWFATGAARRLTARFRDQPDCPARVLGVGRTWGTGRAGGSSWPGRTRWSGFTLGWRLALPARRQEKEKEA